MNRYVIEGAVRDAAAGKKVLLVRHLASETHEAFTQACAAADSQHVQTIYRTHGQQEIRFRSGGRLIFRSATTGAGRGHAVDVLVLGDAERLSENARQDLVPAVLPGGELITT